MSPVISFSAQVSDYDAHKGIKLRLIKKGCQACSLLGGCISQKICLFDHFLSGWLPDYHFSVGTLVQISFPESWQYYVLGLGLFIPTVLWVLSAIFLKAFGFSEWYVILGSLSFAMISGMLIKKIISCCCQPSLSEVSCEPLENI